MANDIINWIGGTTAVAQVMRLQATSTWASSDTITTTLTAEDGSTTQAVSTTTTSSTIETGVIDPHISDLQASTQSLFSAITWVKNSTDTVQGTAKITGVPFKVLGSETTNSTGVYGNSPATTVANAGPNDFGTVGNFTTQTEAAAANTPANDDFTKFLPHPSDLDNAGNPVSYDVLYGLTPSTTVDLNTLRVPQSYRGSIGDSVNGYYLTLSATDTGTGGKTVINSNCPALWLKGSHTAITVNRTTNGPNALRLAGGTITELRILGSDIKGTIKIANSTVVTNAYLLGMGSVRVVFGTSGTATSIFKMDSGVVENDHAITALTISGGQLTHFGGAIVDADNYGGYVFYNSTDNNEIWNNYSGTLDLSQNMADSLTMGGGSTTSPPDGVFIWAGVITDRGGLANVTYGGVNGNPTGITVYGGNVQSETATLIVVT